MGFFSDLMKNPLMQVVAPMALSYFMPGIGSLIGTSAISNPMMRSAAEQALLGYGTAQLTGSRHPEKAAMYAGLGSMPFSFMKAQGAADAFNKRYVGADDLYKTQRDILTPAREAVASQPIYGGEYGKIMGRIPAIPAAEATYGPWSVPNRMAGTGKFGAAQTLPSSTGLEITEADEIMKQLGGAPEKLTAWDVLKGKEYNIPATRDVDTLRQVHMRDDQGQRMFNPKTGEPLWDYQTPWDTSQAIIDPITVTPADDVNFYSKIGKGEKNLLGQTLKKDETFTDWTPTIASQTAGWYGGRPTEEEEWEDAKARRRKELAFMYGVPEDMLGGELQNPYYTGGGFWKDGGIAALEMDNGGAVDGPGGPKDDVIDAKLSDGEFVMTAKAVENLGGGDRMAGAKRMYNMMNQLDPQSETVQESVIGVA